MALPIVAVIGRPNVGKSTLVNRLAGAQAAIVYDQPGVTRDRTYQPAFWRDRDYQVVDTGGLVFNDDSEFLPHIREQAQLALVEAQAAVLVVDGQAGPTEGDREIASWLRQQPVPVLLAVNKCESIDQGIVQAAQFWELGLGEPYPVSGIHGSGTGELLDALVEYLPVTVEEPDLEEIKVAIVGRPNVGKSSLLNAFVGESRAIVSPVSGTTRDALDTQVRHGDQTYRLIDTAGIRKKKSVEYGPEFFGINRAFKAIRRADVVLLVIDALDGVTEQDQKLAGRIEEEGRACVIVVNKWDAVEKDTFTIEQYKQVLKPALNFIDYAPYLFISAKTGQRVNQVLPLALLVQRERLVRISTGQLNRLLMDAQHRHAPTSRTAQTLKIYYGAQVRNDPPTFLLHVNHPRLAHFTYLRYLENQLRQQYPFSGTPIRFLLRARKR